MKFKQVFFRLKKSIVSPKNPHVIPYNVRYIGTNWQYFTFYSNNNIVDNEFEFLNKRHIVTDWNQEGIEKLWLYNLHYFDYLQSKNIYNDKKLYLINDWILNNPYSIGNGWEPYPTSLRIVNWIKFSFKNQISKEVLDSLSLQSHSLYFNLEYHLMGNHLFANAKALIFSGTYFCGDNASLWLAKGLSILDSELPEQILNDGGNFELSPMYHQTFLVDMLDLINLAHTYNTPELKCRLSHWEAISSKMLSWMNLMNHPDKEVSFFNDSAIGVAPSSTELYEYARLLNVSESIIEPSIVTSNFRAVHLKNSAYTIVESDNLKAILDTAKIGPDYIPGHAHADNLSFELSLFSQRIFVNSGTGEYGISKERLRQRKTAAHNTIEIDGQDSSEVWSGFRVAKRAYPLNFELNKTISDTICVQCAHDGYFRLHGKPIHRRMWTFATNRIRVVDELIGSYSKAISHLHIHPDVKITQLDSFSVSLLLLSGETIHFQSSSPITIVDTTWHPQFGLNIPNKKITFEVIKGFSEFSIHY